MRIRLSCALLALAVTPAFAATCEKTAYGAGVTLTETTAISAILEQPAAFTGKVVRVEGEVREVCEQVVKVKVKDGEIVFPLAARGKQAVAQGKVEDLEMSRAKYVQYREHAAKEQGEKFDEASIKGDGPFHVYQIAGFGAEICNSTRIL